MIVLGIDSSTQVNTIALLKGGILIAETNLNTKKNHSQRLMPMINMALTEAGLNINDIDGIAVSLGPGSFTGLRIGITTAKAIAWSLNKPLVGIPSLDGVAFNAQGVSGIICPILNARRQEVYTSLYGIEDGELKRLSEYMAVEPMKLIKVLKEKQGQIFLLGDGVEEFGDLFTNNLGNRLVIPVSSSRLPRASHIAYLGWKRILQGDTDNVLDLSPLYIRKSEAEIKLEQRKRDA